ncbi:hypothetical protein evm_007519 [Chilo suppressalis]|nr:hypothetical protein evm_007519 [Chilo suppressalis]
MCHQTKSSVLLLSKKTGPNIAKLTSVVREELIFNGSREHLRKVLKSLGFKYKKCQSERTALMENLYIAAELRKDVIYLDESYVHQSYKLKKCWQSFDVCVLTQCVKRETLHYNSCWE